MNGAFCCQVTNLDESAEKVTAEHPEQAEEVKEQLEEIKTAWTSLQQMVRPKYHADGCFHHVVATFTVELLS